MWVTLLLLACWQPSTWRPDCVTLRVAGQERNLVQPYEAALDLSRRRLWVTSLAQGAVGEIDLDHRRLITTHPVSGRALDDPDVVVDDQGDVWVSSRRPPALFLLKQGADNGHPVLPGLEGARSLLPLPGGGVVVLGTDERDGSVLQRFGPDGAVGHAVSVDATARSLMALDGGQNVGILYDGRLDVVTAAHLLPVRQCEVPFAAGRGAQLADGTILVTAEHHIGRVGCDGQAPEDWVVGDDNKDVVAANGSALVLDRWGGGDGTDPNYGLARWVGPGGPLDLAPIPLGKHSGFGGLDPDTNLLWTASEGTAEVWALDVRDGAVAARIRTGIFLDGIAVDPEVPGVRYLTGRLSNTLARMSKGGTIHEVTDIFWPYSPVVDPDRDVVWVLSETTSVLHARHRGDLSEIHTFDPALGPNTTLTFSTIALHPTRHTLFVAQGQRDLLAEVDPDGAGVVAVWNLGGPLITDRDQIGELAVLVAPDGAVLVARSNDGRVQRIEPDGSTVYTRWVPEVEGRGLPEESYTDFARMMGEVLYVGRYAVDSRSLERRGGDDLRANRLVGEFPGSTIWSVVLDTERHVMGGADAAGRRMGEVPYAGHAVRPIVARPEPLMNTVLISRGAQAVVCPVEARRLE